MAKLVPGKFQIYEFTESEMQIAGVFTELQEQWIHTQIALAAQDKIQIEVDPENLDKFRLEHEFSRGYIAGLEYLLAVHEELKTSLANRLREEIETKGDRS